MIIDQKIYDWVSNYAGIILDVRMLSGGANHKVFKIIGTKNTLVVKKINENRSQAQQKFSREIWGANFFESCHINVPKVIDADRESLTIIYEYIESSNNNIAEINEFCNFVKKVNMHPTDESYPHALGNGLVEANVIIDCEQRIQALSKINEPSNYYTTHLKNIIDKLSVAKACSPNYSGGLGRVFSAGDFGRHNTIVTDTECFFIDFEFSGVDDLSKLLFDFVLHPAQCITHPERQIFFNSVTSFFGLGSESEDKYSFYFSIYKLRWSLIVLNIFLPAFSDRNTNMLAKEIQKNMEDQLNKSTYIFNLSLQDLL